MDDETMPEETPVAPTEETPEETPAVPAEETPTETPAEGDEAETTVQPNFLVVSKRPSFYSGVCSIYDQSIL